MPDELEKEDIARAKNDPEYAEREGLNQKGPWDQSASSVGASPIRNRCRLHPRQNDAGRSPDR